MSGGVREQLPSLELLFVLWLLLSTPFSYSVKSHLGKQEERNNLPYVSKNGRRVVGLPVIEYLLCAGIGPLHIHIVESLQWSYEEVACPPHSMWLLNIRIRIQTCLTQTPEGVFNYFSAALCRARRVFQGNQMVAVSPGWEAAHTQKQGTLCCTWKSTSDGWKAIRACRGVGAGGFGERYGIPVPERSWHLPRSLDPIILMSGSLYGSGTGMGPGMIYILEKNKNKNPLVGYNWCFLPLLLLSIFFFIPQTS